MRTIKEAISELRRELNVRERCYPRWVADGKLDETDAQDRLERMQAAVAMLQDWQMEEDARKASAMPTDAELAKKNGK